MNDTNQSKQKTTKAELISMRGKILHHFSSVEMGMSCYICLYYFGNPNNFDFVHTVLYDKYMNVGIMANIYEKLLERRGEDKKFINKLISQIRELTRIRNIFAHGWVSTSGNNTDEMNLIGPKSMDDTYDVQKEYAKFLSLFEDAQVKINNLCANFQNKPNNTT